MYMKNYLILISILTLAINLNGKISFETPDISKENELLFSCKSDSADGRTAQTLFYTDIASGNKSALTYYPEKSRFLASTGQFQVYNKFGLFRTDRTLSRMSPVPFFPSFSKDNILTDGQILSISTSLNGHYVLYQKQVTTVSGQLILLDLLKFESTVISEDFPLVYNHDPAEWSFDSKYFIYSKEQKLYYFSIDQIENSQHRKENNRFFGEGSLNAALWEESGKLVVIRNELVYTLKPSQFMTLALYGDYFHTSEILGKLPYYFDGESDSFWLSPDKKNIIINRSGRSIYVYSLSRDDFYPGKEMFSRSYLLMPESMRIKELVWNRKNEIVILASVMAVKGHISSVVFRHSLNKERNINFLKTSEKNIHNVVLSPGGNLAALLSEEDIIIKNIYTWETIREIKKTFPLDLFWKSEGEIIVAGSYLTSSYILESLDSKLISLSQSDKFGFSSGDEKITTEVLGKAYSYLSSGRAWIKVEYLTTRALKSSSDRYRVYVEDYPDGPYKNIIMVRDKKGFGSKALFLPEAVVYEAFPENEDPVGDRFFDHGSRIRRREVSLVFNAVNDAGGLTDILSVLNHYNLKASFFLNGEFIRRNPEAVKHLSETGHEIGSLFFAYFDFNDSRFKVDKNFIIQGLARNEDDYFKITGKELSRYWHAPFYIFNNSIMESSEIMNYIYIGRDVDPLDWVGKDQYISRDRYLSSGEIIQRIINLKKPGSIIPVKIGKTDVKRDDYLFNYLDVLINALVKSGYSIVPVSELRDHAK